MSDTYKYVLLENPEDSSEKWLPKTSASNVTLTNGEDVETELGKKYEKPSSGIPATDLASGVIPDTSGKVDKPTTATENNIAIFDTDKNIKDSGNKTTDFLQSANMIVAGTASSTQSVTFDTTNPYVNLLLKRKNWSSSADAHIRFVGGNGISVVGNAGSVTISLPAPTNANTFLKYNGSSYEWADAGGSSCVVETWTLTTSTGTSTTKNVLIQQSNS